MKRILLACGLAAALLGLSQNASAQYNQIRRDGTNFVDQTGRALSDQALIDLVGEDVYFDTVVGARKQYNAGRKLILGGAIGLGAGCLSALGGAALLIANGTRPVVYYESGYRSNYPDRDYYYDDYGDGLGALAGGALLVGGYCAMIAGSLVLEAGIPLKIIGKSRLNWVENDFNDRSREASLRFGAAPSGLGLTLTF